MTPQAALTKVKALLAHPLKRGGNRKLAQKLGISDSAVCQWEIVPPEHVLSVEKLAGGAVDRHDLRPDIYGRRPREKKAAA